MKNTRERLRSNIMDEVTGIILSYNVPEKLVICVESLLAQPEIKELILIENHSKVNMDMAYARIRTMCVHSGVDFVFYRPEHALSFSDGQNWGIDHATHDLVLLMNNDAMITEKNSLKSSIALITDDVYIVGHKIINPDGTCNHHGVFVDGLWRHIDHLGRGFGNDDVRLNRTMSLFAVTAACVLVRKSSLRFDSVYWFEFEDVDFCLQHIRSGKKVVCNAAMTVLHEESSTRAEPQATNKVWQEKQRVGQAYFHKKWRWFLMLRTWKVLTQWPLLPDAYKAHLRQTIGDVVGVTACVGVLLTGVWSVVGLRWEVVLFQVLALGFVFIGVKALCVFFLKKLT